jgi:predicted flap endonuclease-1-like 5' DNA nuclease
MPTTAELKNAPPLYGWILAKAAAIVAFGISYLVIDLGFMGSAMMAVVIWLVVGVIFTVAEAPKAGGAAAPAEPVAVTTPAPAPAPTAPAPAPAPAAQASASVAAAVAEAPAATATEETSQPAALSGPIGAADDLKQINGVGPVLEGKLNNLGIYHFWQIARWTDAEVAWVDGFLNFKGRIGRDNWISQAVKLAETSPAKPPR